MGVCAKTGRTIQEQATADYCPAGRFGNGEPVEPVPAQSIAVPRNQWPFVVRVLASRKAEGERGVGDTAKRLLHKMGADGLAWLYEKATGRDCGCGDRQEKLNRLYPYESEQPGAAQGPQPGGEEHHPEDDGDNAGGAPQP
jgi:hypothetical protein